MGGHAEKSDITIRRLEPREAEIISKMVGDVVQPLAYYNERARKEELAKYSPENLRTLIDEDSDSVLIAEVNGQPGGFCISKYDDGLIWVIIYLADHALASWENPPVSRLLSHGLKW